MFLKKQTREEFIESMKNGSGFSENELDKAYTYKEISFLISEMTLENDDIEVTRRYLECVSDLLMNIILESRKDHEKSWAIFLGELSRIEHLWFDDFMINLFESYGINDFS